MTLHRIKHQKHRLTIIPSTPIFSQNQSPSIPQQTNSISRSPKTKQAKSSPPNDKHRSDTRGPQSGFRSLLRKSLGRPRHSSAFVRSASRARIKTPRYLPAQLTFSSAPFSPDRAAEKVESPRRKQRGRAEDLRNRSESFKTRRTWKAFVRQQGTALRLELERRVFWVRSFCLAWVRGGRGGG